MTIERQSKWMHAFGANTPQDKDRRDARSQNEICSGEQDGAAQSLCLRGVFATAGTGLHELSTSRRYCGVECYPLVSRFVGSVATTNPFELAIAWPKLTVNVASALFDSAWAGHGG